MIPQENKLLNLLSNNDVTFFIPPYQRNYEWDEDQCKIFFEDIKKTAAANSTEKIVEHFFGTVTYFQTDAIFGQPNKLVLIDGQQRITTTMLFLVALRDILRDENMKNHIDARYLKNNNITGDVEYKIKLKQVETDWLTYKKIILNEDLCNKEKISAVYRNYRYFYSKLSAYQSDENKLFDLIQNGLSKFSVITIQLQPEQNVWENPQEIFESMNSLGKPLSLADLVRNYLLLGLDAEKQEELYKKYWLHIENTIPGQVSNFIRDYMQAMQAKSYLKATEKNYKELYRQFKVIFAKEDAEDLLKNLAEYSDIYAYFSSNYSTGNTSIDQQLMDLGGLNVTTAYSFLMVLINAWKHSHFMAKDVADIVFALRIYCARRRLLALTQAENKVFPQYVREIHELELADDKKKKMFEILANQENNLRLPNDIELSRHLANMNFYNFGYVKFYLSLIEEKITRSRPAQNDENLQVEHIMPQKLNEKWIKELGDEFESIHQELVHTIGNLTLIRHNQELGNKSFYEKKVIYENNAGLQIAKTMITNQNHWSKNEIQERSTWIIDFMLREVLPIPDNMRKVNNFKNREGRYLSFQNLQLIGTDISFIDDPSIVAHVVSDNEVEFEGKKWRLSPLTREIQTRRGLVSPSGAYQGAQYWQYDDIKLADIM